MSKDNINFVLKFLTFYFTLISLKTNSVEYEPTWESLDKRPLPEWYDNAKVGLLVHWGVMSVPSWSYGRFASAWRGDNISEFYRTYPDIEKQFTTELFDGKEWALLFKDSGAKYVILKSKNSDGYTLWPSTYSPEWNSLVKTPKRDLANEFRHAIKAHTSLRFGFQHTLHERFNPMYVADEMDETQQTFVTNKVHPEIKQLVNFYQPDILRITDGFYKPPNYWNWEEILVWLYNESPVKRHIVCYDDGVFDRHGSHGDVLTDVPHEKKFEELFNTYEDLYKHNKFYSSKEVIHGLVKAVGRGGNFLLKIVPTRFGNIARQYEERLREMGKWLKNNGEAIYSCKNVLPYDTSPDAEIWYTTEKIPSLDNRIIVYAIFLKYPFGIIDLDYLGNKTDVYTTISILGVPNTVLNWTDTNDVLRVNLPEDELLHEMGLEHAWTLKITLPDESRRVEVIPF